MARHIGWLNSTKGLPKFSSHQTHQETRHLYLQQTKYQVLTSKPQLSKSQALNPACSRLPSLMIFLSTLSRPFTSLCPERYPHECIPNSQLLTSEGILLNPCNLYNAIPGQNTPFSPRLDVHHRWAWCCFFLFLFTIFLF